MNQWYIESLIRWKFKIYIEYVISLRHCLYENRTEWKAWRENKRDQRASVVFLHSYVFTFIWNVPWSASPISQAPSRLFKLRSSRPEVFSYEFCKISKNTFSYRTPLVATSVSASASPTYCIPAYSITT